MLEGLLLLLLVVVLSRPPLQVDDLLKILSTRVTVDGVLVAVILMLVWEIRRVRASEARWMRIALSTLGVLDKATEALEKGGS